MTPAIQLLKQRRIEHRVHRYTHAPMSHAYGLEAAEKLGIPTTRVFKTLVVQLDKQAFAVGVIPVSTTLSMKAIAKAAGAKKANMALPIDVERTTGYVLGGVSPLGQKKRLATLIDRSAQTLETLYISAGRRGLEIELKPDDLQKLVDGTFTSLCA
ncbi:MAG TPA: Cys-tRNA(Pro) deacylase [Porticoccaceae bacterium]|nr:Cys-tRNA(Pro) deacylase [Porticoccaceae bacterium]